MAAKSSRQRQNPVKITVSEDGPYIVSGDIPLSEQIIVADDAGFSAEWRKGEDYSHEESYSLCRCGRSKAKPFCDGSHAN
ncbi:MAG: CDGSH iron-sulfur domain-containing protein [Candidatus Bathyarchaeota archaeon]|nr:CDGSH iron-sulfur domain-containing protein [Candidatus Bathyarchaeota archaeon]